MGCGREQCLFDSMVRVRLVLIAARATTTSCTPTYDVHLYASFALAMPWPMLELSLQQDVAAAVIEVSRCGARRQGQAAMMRAAD